jgi:hypothetical protein
MNTTDCPDTHQSLINLSGSHARGQRPFSLVLRGVWAVEIHQFGTRMARFCCARRQMNARECLNTFQNLIDPSGWHAHGQHAFQLALLGVWAVEI